MTYSPTSPVFARSRVTTQAFAAFLRARRSPATIEASAIHAVLADGGVDPAVALGQFAAESSYGLAGYAKATRNWGNIAMATPGTPRLLRASKIASHWSRAFGATPYSPGNGYTYASFPNWRAGARAYVALLKTYRLRGWAKSIASMSSKWLGMRDATNSGYVRNIVRVAGSVPTTATPPPAPTPAPKPAPTPAAVSPETIANLRTYISNLETKLATYKARLADYLKRGSEVPPAPTPAPPSVHPPIPLQATQAPSLIGPLPTLPETRPVLGNHPGIAVGTNGPVFVLVHGGPSPVPSPYLEHTRELAQRLAVQGVRAYAIDYRSDTWQNAVADVEVAIASVRLLAPGPVTVVAHSTGGLAASVAVLRDGLADALVMVAALNSPESAPEYVGMPDPVALASLRPRVPVTVIRGKLDLVAPLDRKEAFIAALHTAGHPGLNVMGAGGHSDTLYTDSTLDAIFATSRLI